MKRSRFTEEQIIAVLREQEAGVSTAEVCRKHGISSATFYAWRRSSAVWTSCEAFNGRMRDEPLNETIIYDLDHARSVLARWFASYNQRRPHSALGYLTPTAYAANLTATGDRLRNPDQLRPSPVAPPAQLRQSQQRTLASARWQAGVTARSS